MNGPAPLLQWGDRSHWAQLAKPCRHCGDLTHLRDNERRPSHKVCAEQALTDKDAR